ncbi:MAG: hypothetical protein KBG84_01030 [Planctomycetes bacterium]|nr:hypothetical protein [Planctomycetota bacterium]
MKRILTLSCFFMVVATLSQRVPQAQEATRTLTLAEAQDPGTLDPHLAGDVVSSRHVMLVYESLLEFDPFDHTRLRPCLAAEMPAYDADNLTYTFKLREDTFFADDACFPGGKGRKITAADFVYSFKRLAALPQLSNYWVIDGAIAGLDEFRTKAHRLKGDAWRKHLSTEVSGLRMPDERTLVIKLVRPLPQFLYIATMGYLAALSHEACDAYGDALGKHPVGTGPYVLKEWKPAAHLIYERNPAYRDVRLRDVPSGSSLKALEGARLPLSDRIRFEVQDNDKQSFERFLSGEFSRIGLSRDQRKQLFDEKSVAAGVKSDELLKAEYRAKGIKLLINDEPVFDYISFNMTDEVVGAKAGAKGKAIRKALALCVDRDALVRDHKGGMGAPATALIPPGVPGHEDSFLLGQRLDTQSARELLRKAGFRVEKRLTKWRALNDAGEQVSVNLLLRSANDDARAYAQFIAQCAEQVGLKVVCEFLSFREFLERQDEGKGQAFDCGWAMDYPDAQNVTQLLYGPHKPPGINASAFGNADYDKCYEELALLSDQVEAQRKRKLELIRRMSEIVEEESPWVLLSWHATVQVCRSSLRAPPPCSFSYTQLKYTVNG